MWMRLTFAAQSALVVGNRVDAERWSLMLTLMLTWTKQPSATVGVCLMMVELDLYRFCYYQ